MLLVKKVFFNQTVHWAGLGPITEISDTQFHDAMWVENMPGFAFEHASGEITWVPASNIRWAHAVIKEAAEPTDIQVSSDSDIGDNVEPIKRKPGRPRKMH